MKPIIFFNIASYKNYDGSLNDKLNWKGGGKYVKEHGGGHEKYNFKHFNGFNYGYVEPSHGRIRLERLGARKSDGQIDGVLVIWVGTRQQGGMVVIGWYENATVCRSWQAPPPESNRTFEERECGYYVYARREDCTLLAVEDRTFSVPRANAGGIGFGQSNVWYPEGQECESFKQGLFEYVQSKTVRIENQQDEIITRAWQHDLYKRQLVEKNAIDRTKMEFTRLGYVVKSVEKDNVGWDLEALKDVERLRLEVKGLSGRELVIELTPNEFQKLSEHKSTYKICVLTNALSDNPTYRVFSHHVEQDAWEDEERKRLIVKEIMSARMTLR